ncbi:MAG: dsRBD fold-containing protein [Actinomycetota bacterium]
MGEAIQTWKVEIHLFDHDDSTSADAVLTTHTGTRIHGHGRARRNPSDADVPEIGEELAAARALRHLADRLLETASADISQIEHTEVHLKR